MKLTINEYPVRSMAWGESTEYKDGHFTVNKESLLTFLQDAGDLEDVVITDMALVDGLNETRIVNIFDVLPALYRMGEGVNSFPGFLSPFQIVGDGCSAFLEDFSVLALSPYPARFNKVLDKTGYGKSLSPYGSHCHLTFTGEMKEPDMNVIEYQTILKRIGLRIGVYLAQKAYETPAANSEVYTTEAPASSEELPRAVYVCMLAAMQHWHEEEKILYGNNLNNLLPTVLHPNEFLDGAVVATCFNLCIDTYTYVNNRVIKEIYRRHGRDLLFTGVVVNVAYAAREDQERSRALTVKLVCDVLNADIAVITKMGGGIPETDVMSVIEGAEKRGVKTVGIVWGHDGGGMNEVLTAFSQHADAVVSVGIEEPFVELPEIKHVIGGNEIDFLSNNPESGKQKSAGPLMLRYANICAAVDQLGGGRVSIVEV